MCTPRAPRPGIGSPPKGVILDDPALIHAHAKDIYLNAARTDAMPPANVTELEPAERGAIAAWYEAGEPAEGSCFGARPILFPPWSPRYGASQPVLLPAT